MNIGGWKVVWLADPLRAHVIPCDDLREHTLSEDCWCNPSPGDRYSEVLTHNSADKREEFEKGIRKMS